jgi:hypothetical protein
LFTNRIDVSWLHHNPNPKKKPLTISISLIRAALTLFLNGANGLKQSTHSHYSRPDLFCERNVSPGLESVEDFTPHPSFHSAEISVILLSIQISGAGN